MECSDIPAQILICTTEIGELIWSPIPFFHSSATVTTPTWQPKRLLLHLVVGGQSRRPPLGTLLQLGVFYLYLCLLNSWHRSTWIGTTGPDPATIAAKPIPFLDLICPFPTLLLPHSMFSIPVATFRPSLPPSCHPSCLFHYPTTISRQLPIHRCWWDPSIVSAEH